MQIATKEKAAPSPKSATNTTNERNLTTQSRRYANPPGCEDRRNWRPVRIGELVGAALDSLLRVGVRP